MHGSTLMIAAVLMAGAFASSPVRAGDPASAGALASSGGTAAAMSLEQAVSIAASGTPAVQMAALRMTGAEARRGQARAALLPTFSGSAFSLERTYSLKATGISFPKLPGISFPDLIGPVNQVDARLRASQSLFDAAAWLRLRSAGLGVGVSRAEAGGSAEAAAQTTALAYVRATRAAAVVSARDADLGLARQLASLAEDQVRAGTAARIDVIRARTQEAAARGALLVAQNQAARATIDLARALGFDPVSRFVLSDTLSTTLGSSAAPAETDAAITLALAQRPELAAERSRLARAGAERRAIQAERLPRLDFSADYGLSGAHSSDALATRTVMLAASMPIFDGLRREGRIAEQRAVARESEVRERDLRQQIAAEVLGAALDVSSGLEQESVAMERLRLAEEELAQARERFASGVAGNIEVINAQSSLLRGRDALIDARTAAAVARIALARAAGVARTVR
jgi:outer membrane protein TolC